MSTPNLPFAIAFLILLSACGTAKIQDKTRSFIWVEPGERMLFIMNEPYIAPYYLEDRVLEKFPPLKYFSMFKSLDEIRFENLFCMEESLLAPSCLAQIKERYDPDYILTADLVSARGKSFLFRPTAGDIHEDEGAKMVYRFVIYDLEYDYVVAEFSSVARSRGFSSEEHDVNLTSDGAVLTKGFRKGVRELLDRMILKE